MYELISHRKLTSPATSIVFSSIPQQYSDLYLVTSLRDNSISVGWENAFIYPNGSSANMVSRATYGWSTNVGSLVNNPAVLYHQTARGGNTANTFSSSSVYINNYASTTSFKTFSCETSVESNGAAAINAITTGLWSSNSAITSLEIVAASNPGENNSFVAGSSATLYGIRRTSPIGKPKATGGSITYSNGYWIHTFTGSGNFIPSQNMSVDTLILAGGGGGGTPGASRCGGGGAGGIIQTSMSGIIRGTSYPVVVGAGGGIAATGSNSSFNNQVAFGGGFGASNVGQAGGAGGSGGGGNRVGMAGGAPVAGQGFVGGFGSTSGSASDSGGGGGGGAGGAGNHLANNAFTNEPAGGGAGILSSISGTATWYAEGGAGSGAYDRGIYNQNLGGNVSGAGHINGNAQTGSGGGGGKDGTAGGAGGSGIVIIRYLAN